MSYMKSIRETEAILNLVESIDADYMKEMEENKPVQDNDPFGTVSLDDINDTVETNDDPITAEPLIGEVELTEQEKTIVRQHLKDMLDDIQGDDISEPALEMIIQEVAQNSAFLTEADEDRINSPVEKNQLIKAKIDAITNYAKDLLSVAADNDGVIPETEEDSPIDSEGSEGSEESGEGSESSDDSEGSEGSDEGLESEDKPVVESNEAGEDGSVKENDSDETPVVESSEPEDEAVKPVEEGVCTECGDDVVDVPEDEVIKVVDDSEVQPLDGIGVEESPEPEYATKADIDELKEMLKSIVGNTTAVLESAGLIKNTDPIKNVEGGNPSALGKPTHSSAQKKSTPSYSQPGFKVAELRDLASAPKKTNAGAPFTSDNESSVSNAQPGFKKDSQDKGKSSTTPDGGIPSVQGAPKKNTPGVTNPTNAQKAAVLRESANKTSAKSWLEEARAMIHNS